jgi:hypothetical protein
LECQPEDIFSYKTPRQDIIQPGSKATQANNFPRSGYIPPDTKMKPFHANGLATLVLLCALARQAAAAPPQATPAAPPSPTTLAVPPSEPLLQLAKATPTALSPDYKLEVELQDPVLELELKLPLLRDHDSGTKLDLRAATTAVAAAPAAAPAITPAPAEGDTSGGEWWHTGVDGNGDTFRYRQTTYYSCVTQESREHCGWHRPILEVSGAGGLGERTSWVFGVGGRALVVGFAAGIFAYLMGR